MRPEQVLARSILAALAATASRPLIVALDGRSGAGKSTVATSTVAEVASLTEPGAEPPIVEVIEGDDFYAGGDAAFWDARNAAEKAAHGIDWRRQREVLADLRSTGTASWYPFDWTAEDWDAFDVKLSTTPLSCGPADVVILEGAYSARPELAGSVDLRVLLDTPAEECQQRLRAREGAAYAEDWEARWRQAEDHYFSRVMPASAFDLVIVDGRPTRPT